MIKMTFHEQQGGRAEENEVCENKIHLPACHGILVSHKSENFRCELKIAKSGGVFEKKFPTCPTLESEGRRIGEGKKCITYL